MNSYELKDFNKRVGLNTSLDDISSVICDLYNLGSFVSSELITIGYEDFNYYLTTSKNKYFVKILNKIRDAEDKKCFLDRIRIVAKSDISAPKPLVINDDIYLSLDYKNNHYDLCVFEYIDGKSLYELNERPADSKTIKELVKQMAMIHNLDYKLSPSYDAWTITNFKKEYEDKKDYLPEELQEQFKSLLADFNNIDFEKLPKALIHGDIVTSNVIKDKNSKIWIIDFSTFNYLPRIVDLTVTASDVCLDVNSKDNTHKNISLMLNEYNKCNPLTEYEIGIFPLFFKLASAMQILQTSFIAKTQGVSDENQLWFDMGMVAYSYTSDKNFNTFFENF